MAFSRIKMKSITSLVFIILVGVVLAAYESHARKLVNGSCEEVCCMYQKSSRSNQNLTKAFTRCCNESTECVLPKQFYSLSCTEQLMSFCVSTNRSRPTDLTSTLIECCRNVSCPKNNPRLDNRRKCFNITVDWREVSFLRELDLLIKKWNIEQWKFFLKMVSQMCLNKSTSSSRKASVKYMYPYYTKHEEKIVYGYQAPPAFLIEKMEYFTMFTVVGDSFKQLWPTLILCVTWSLISGVIIWLLDRRKNATQFPSSFWGGVREGTWWAVVTMTTVGYGDKAPKSLPARIYSALWMIIGMIIISMFTAEVASGLTSKQMFRYHSFLETKVGVPYFSLRHFEEEIRGAMIIEVESREHLVKHLENGSKKLDKIILHGCDKNDTDEDYQSVLALEKHFVGIFTNVPSIVTCVKEMVEEHHDNDGFDDEKTPQCKENSQIERGYHYKREQSDYSDMTNITLYASLGLVVVMLVVGSVWDLMKANNLLQKEEANDVQDNGNIAIVATKEAIIDVRAVRVIKEDGEDIQT